MGIAQRNTFRPAIRGIAQKLRGRLPQSREVWLVSIGWHISALFLFLTLWLSQDFPELSFLALFVSIYVHVVVNRRLAERKLKAHDKSETIRRRRELEAVRQDLTTHLDTTTQAVRQDLTTHLDTTNDRTRRWATESLASKEALTKKTAENYLAASGISFLSSRLDSELPIWFERSWAASPALLAHLYGTIMKEKPGTILDLGSGFSTLVASLALKVVGSGKVVAWEHLKKYQAKTNKLLRNYGASQHASVVHTPLVRTKVGAQYFQWYSGTSDIGDGEIDLLIVDGPPGHTGKLARFPALPLLLSKLSPGATIFLDDSAREDERETVRLWNEMVPNLDIQEFGEGTKLTFSVLKMPRRKP